MIHQLNIYGKDKVETSINRIKTFEPPEGYYLAFSGGKDSVVIKALADMAGVKYDAHYNITSVDPPELVQFVKSFPDVARDHQYWDRDGTFVKKGDPITMWNLIPEKGLLPTRIIRYCCAYLKEQSGHDRFVITGVRHAESVRRGRRGGLEVPGEENENERERVDPDNPNQELIHICQRKSSRILNPIIDWTDDEVWEFIHEYNLRYCKLYDQGYKRLGCIGCPMNRHAKSEFERYPKYKANYMKAIERMIERNRIKGKASTGYNTAEEWWDWWVCDKK